MEYIEILENNRPWDCEVFPKSKTICYGGGGSGVPFFTPPKLPTLPKLPTPNLSAVTDTLDQGLGGIGQGLDQIGKPLAQGMADLGHLNIPTPNLEQVSEGIDHNLKQGTNTLGTVGQGVMGLLGMGGKGGGGAGGGAGAIGPISGGLARMGASKLQMKKVGMGRRQTYLTKG